MKDKINLTDYAVCESIRKEVSLICGRITRNLNKESKIADDLELSPFWLNQAKEYHSNAEKFILEVEEMEEKRRKIQKQAWALLIKYQKKWIFWKLCRKKAIVIVC